MPQVKDLGLANDKIVSITKTSGTSQPGQTDTYTITLRSGSTYSFQVTNGLNGSGLALWQPTGIDTLSGLISGLNSRGITTEKIVKIFATWNSNGRYLKEVILNITTNTDIEPEDKVITGLSGRVIDTDGSIIDADSWAESGEGRTYWVLYQQQTDPDIDIALDINSSNPVQNKAITEFVDDTFDLIQSPNLLDRSTVVVGYMDKYGNYVSTSTSYRLTDYIPVEPGQTISLQYSSTIDSTRMRFVTAFDRNKRVISSAGSDEATNSIVVAANVKYLRITAYQGSFASENNAMIIVGSEVIPYVPYYRYYAIKEESLGDETKAKIDNAQIVYGLFEIVRSKNLLDVTKLTTGVIIQASGASSPSSDYNATDYLMVEPGQVIIYKAGGSVRSWRFLCAYDEQKRPIESAGNNAGGSSYTVPNGVSFIRMTIYEGTFGYDKQIIYVDGTVDGYTPYFDPKYILKATSNNDPHIKEIAATNPVGIEQLDFAEWENYFNKDTATPAVYVYMGAVMPNSSYFASDFIEVEPNTDYAFAANASYPRARFVDEYNAEKTAILDTANVATLRTTANTKYIRVTFENYAGGAVISATTIIKGTVPTWGLPHVKLIPSSYIKETPNVKAFLPKEICCAVGTTIEIYNDQVMPCADKYHFQWTCNVGKPLNRKFSVTGVSGNVGTYTLQLAIYDDNMSIVASASSTIKIVNALSTSKSVCPIGDSLTNGKYWLKYVNVDLSNGNLAYVGTRGSTTGQKHEGRSGWSAGAYLSDTTYDYEQPATPNPFWDSSLQSFSWDYYKNTYSINPDAVQIWLGTNDLLGTTAANFVNQIKTMVSKIRSDDANIPIFVCLTILPAEQNGIGIQTSSDGFSSAGGRWQYNWWNTIIDGVKLLDEELIALNDSNLHIIPLVCSHDSKYNFGINPTPVNPHTPSITEPMPVEGVHPQQNGYEQIADIMFGSYSAHL